MSHEIRTPMNGVIGMTGLLMDTELSEEQIRYAETIRSSGETLLMIINDILDFSKIEAGKLELENIDFNLQTMLDDFTDSLADTAYDKGIEWICHADGDVPVMINGDPGRVRQILTNLAGNALKFTRAGEVSVHISLGGSFDDQVFLKFSIHDTGIGIAAEKLEMLFQKFSQVDSSTTRHFGGTGLGLAISKQLTQMMNGEIGVESEEGVGSTFWFTAQFTMQDNSDIDIPEPAEQKELAGKRVLIVDDNRTSRTMIAEYLANWNMVTELVTDGHEAMAVLERAQNEHSPFDLILVDRVMPVMDGEELGIVIRKNNDFDSLRMILMPSMAVRGDAKRFSEMGFNGYLPKPLRKRDLLNVIRMVMSDNACATFDHKQVVTKHSAAEIIDAESRKQAKILLAEDNMVNQMVAQGILKKLGYSCDAVADGNEAVKALELINYDIVLMDCQMPEMDGYEATIEIRNPLSAVLNHAVPVIALTAHALPSNRDRCFDAGMDDVLTKPIDPATLAEKLRYFLSEELYRHKSSNGGRNEEHSSNDHPINLEEFTKRLGGDQDVVTEVLKLIPDSIRENIDILTRAVESLAFDTIARTAHLIKGIAANIEAHPLRSAASQLEDEANEQNSSALKRLVETVLNHATAVVESVESILRNSQT